MKTIFIIFWATGDLAKRKLFPALTNICEKKSDINIFWVWRRDFSISDFREYTFSQTKEFVNNSKSLENFCNKLDYINLNITESLDYKKLQEKILSIYDDNTQTIVYLAISPDFFEIFIENYKNFQLPNVKVIFEKPFWTDLETATKLNQKIMEVFDENQVYRIDHYLAKEAVQNILAFRFSNSIFQAIWNNKFIDNIQISACESIGVWDRGAYYDNFWALRDMLQNHLFQILSLVVMDSPASLDAEFINDEKIKVLKNIDLWESFENNIFFWQYNWYINELWIPKNSKTETFVAMKIEVNTWNFNWVPIYLRTWKYMKKKNTQIVIEFKEIPHLLFKKFWNIEKNRIIIEIQPNESIELNFNIKTSEQSKKVESVSSKFNQENISKEAYEKLLIDVMNWDKTLFTSWKVVQESWKIVDNIVHCKDNCPILHIYEKWKDWPEISDNLLKKDNKMWYGN